MNNDFSPQLDCGVSSKEDMFDYSLQSSAESNREGIEITNPPDGEYPSGVRLTLDF